MHWHGGSFAHLRLKAFSRILIQTVTILLMAAGLLGTLISSFITIALAVVCWREGRLLTEDRQVLGQAVKWLFLGVIVVGVGRWFYLKVVVKNPRDDTFKLVRSKSTKTEALAFRVTEICGFLILASWIYSSSAGNIVIRISLAIGWLIIALLASYACVGFHELGHLVTAWCLKMKLCKIQVGVGPVIWSHRSPNRFLWQWRAWPYGGFTFAFHPTVRSFRIRHILFVAGGPLGDLILLCATYEIITRFFGGLGEAWSSGPGGVVAVVGFWRHAIGASEGLIPLKFWFEGQQIWTDGYWLFRLVTSSNATIQQLASASNWTGTFELHSSDNLENGWFPTGPKLQAQEQMEALPGFQEQQAVLSSQLRRPGR